MEARISLVPKTRKAPWDKSIKQAPHVGTLVGFIIDDYLKSSRYHELAWSTKQAYLASLRFFDGLILNTGTNIFKFRAHKVTFSTVEYIQTVLKHTKKPAWIKFHFTVMNNVWDNALRKGYVHNNPWVRPHIKVSNERDITWTREQIETAINTAKRLGYDVLALYLRLAYETVQRPWQDLRNLKWDNIKDDVSGQVLDFVISKTNTRILVPLSPRAQTALKEQKRISEYVFADKIGTRPVRMAIHNHFKRVLEAAGLPEDLQIRDLRRTGVTEMAENGCTALEIEALTGWRCTEAVIRRYARVRLKTAQHALSKRESGRVQGGG